MIPEDIKEEDFNESMKMNSLKIPKQNKEGESFRKS
jgi:hypothetical protein